MFLVWQVYKVPYICFGCLDRNVLSHLFFRCKSETKMAARSGVRDSKTLLCTEPGTSHLSVPVFLTYLFQEVHTEDRWRGAVSAQDSRMILPWLCFPLWLQPFPSTVGKVINVVVPHSPTVVHAWRWLQHFLLQLFSITLFQTHKEPDGWGPPHSLILLAVQQRAQPHLWRNERKDGAEQEQHTEFDPTSFSCYLEDW